MNIKHVTMVVLVYVFLFILLLLGFMYCWDSGEVYGSQVEIYWEEMPDEN